MANKIIDPNLRIDLMRKQIQTKQQLQQKGDLYVGTGETDEYGIYQTKTLSVGSDNTVLTKQNGELIYSKVKNNMMEDSCYINSTIYNGTPTQENPVGSQIAMVDNHAANRYEGFVYIQNLQTEGYSVTIKIDFDIDAAHDKVIYIKINDNEPIEVNNVRELSYEHTFTDVHTCKIYTTDSVNIVNKTGALSFYYIGQEAVIYRDSSIDIYVLR